MSAKRVFDVILSTLFLLLSLPLCIVISCLIRLDSPGPLFAKQRRIGRYKKPFTLFKFRTIRNGAEGVDRQIEKNDECLTKFGKVFRPTHLDELPQLWNVLRGEMSLVGPRPLPLFQLVVMESRFPHYKERASVAPGMTGPVQILGRAEYSIDEGSHAVLLDLEYSRGHTIWGDIKILAKTFVVVFKFQGV